jgi:hypothetical protein
MSNIIKGYNCDIFISTTRKNNFGMFLVTCDSLRIYFVIFLSLLLQSSCKNFSKSGKPESNITNKIIANQFIDAFYSFDRDSLTNILYDAPGSQPEILYYQKWAECGNYKVINRPDCMIRNDSLVICPVTVKDDLIGALKIDFNVTDTFHITIIEGRIRSVTTSSNDPELYHQAKEWVKKNRPALIEVPCVGIWEGGPTPCECVKAMIKGFTEFIAEKDLK